MLDASNLRGQRCIADESCGGKELVGNELQGVGTAKEEVKGFPELEAGLKDVAAAKDVETEARAREGDGHAAKITKVSHTLGPGERQEHN